MFGISMDDCQFVIKKDEGKVICWIEGDKISRLAIDTIIRNHCVSIMPFEALERLGLEMCHRFTGIATLNEGDVWDEAVGKKIAYAIVIKKIMASFEKKITSQLDKTAELLNTTRKACDEIIEAWHGERDALANKIESRLTELNTQN